MAAIDTLTGRIGFRRSILGKLVLRVEYEYQWTYGATKERRWRDASADDLNRLQGSGKIRFVEDR